MSEVDVLEDVAILWQDAEDPFERPCEARRKQCSNVALYLILYQPPPGGLDYCTCGDTQRACMDCKEYVLERHSTIFRCPDCQNHLTLLRVEPLR